MRSIILGRKHRLDSSLLSSLHRVIVCDNKPEETRELWGFFLLCVINAYVVYKKVPKFRANV